MVPADIAVANSLAHEVLGRSLDELPPGTRRLLLVLDELVARECERSHLERRDVRFSRRQLRQWSGRGDTQLKVHLARLVELEYLVVHRLGRGHSFVYELSWDGAGSDGRCALNGLVAPDQLSTEVGYDADRSGSKALRSGSGRPPVGPRSGGGRGVDNAQSANGHRRNHHAADGNGAARTSAGTARAATVATDSDSLAAGSPLVAEVAS